MLQNYLQGKVENNMPAFVLLPPTSLVVEQPDMAAALLANAHHLTSHLDLYVTLREVLAMGSKEQLMEPTRGRTSSSSDHLTNSQVCPESLCSTLLRGEAAPRQVFHLR